MITLDATLQAAQDSLVRNPLIKLVSGTYLPDIPFDGAYFNDLATEEVKPNIISMSTGRIAGTVLRGGDLYLLTTDIERSEWTETLVRDESSSITTACPIELESGDIGIVYVTGTYTFKSVVVSIEDFSVSAPATLFTYPSNNWVGDLHLSQGGDGSIRMVVSYADATPAYYVMYVETSDFETWGSPAPISISGLSDAYRFGNPVLIEATASGEWILFFDYVDDLAEDGSELINIYYQISSDGGLNWGTPVRLTDYTKYGTIGYHPSVAEREDGDLEVAWTEKNNVLHVDGGSDGFQSNCGGSDLYGTDFHYDPATNKLYIKAIYTYVGDKTLCSVVVLDVDTWEIEKCYTTSTIPAYNQIFADSHVWWHRWVDTGQYVCAGVVGGTTAVVIDTVADTIKHYQFIEDINDYGLVKNVDTSFTGTGSFVLKAGYLDADTERLYLLFINDYVYTHKICLGYIDITETADPITGKYTWHEVLVSTLLDNYTLSGFNYMTLIPEMGYIMLAFHSAASWWYGRLLLVSINSGGIVHDFYNPDMPGFHHNGVWYPCYYNGKIYASFTYRSDYDMADKRGLMEIDLASESVRYHVPTYATKDNYGLTIKVPTGDGKIIIGTESDGVVIFDCNSYAWTQYNNTTLPGLTPSGDDSLPSIAYDPATGTIFAGSYYRLDGWNGVAAFSIYGAFYQGLFKTGEFTTGWSFSEAKELTLNRFEKENSICIDETNGMWTFWIRIDSTELSLIWDNEAGSHDLSPYLVSGTPVVIDWSVESPNKLSLTLSHGHLFDPNNQMSVYADVLEMGRLITVQMGELVNAVEYWQNQGVFVVVDSKITYSRGSYPTIQVTCEDISSLWDQGTITATEEYDDADPAQVLADLVTQYGLLDSGTQLDIPTIANSHNIYHQFLDQSLMDCVKTILDHFGYFLHIDVDNRFSPRRINLDAESGHDYSDTHALTSYTPDCAFSNFVNRVTVTGESRDYLEVLYDEESVAAISGVIGWWGENEVKRVYYSEDQERTCRNPRLEILQSVDDFWLFKYMGGGSEGITAQDYYETWVEITIEGPDLTGVVIAEVAVVVATGIAAISCTLNCGVYIFAMCVSISILFYTLACFAAYSYNIWAQPLGEEKQTIQAQADDTELQQKLNGQIIEETIDDALCYEVAHCQRVADYELSIVQAQRKRVRFEKIAHLQDEVGDVITIIHPYSRQSKRVFITDIQRSYTKPSSRISSDGGMVDSISGWILS